MYSDIRQGAVFLNRYQVFRAFCCFTLLASTDGGKDFLRNVFYTDPNAMWP